MVASDFRTSYLLNLNRKGAKAQRERKEGQEIQKEKLVGKKMRPVAMR